MQHWRPRESRKTVRISVRVRTDDGWIDAVVRNVSDRGMMLHSLQPLRRNQFVEVARGRHRVVGRIVWSDASVSGLHSRDGVDLSALLAQAGAVAAPSDERRERPRPAARVATMAERAEASRLRGRAMEFACLVAALACAGAVAVAGVTEAFTTPIATVELALR